MSAGGSAAAAAANGGGGRGSAVECSSWGACCTGVSFSLCAVDSSAARSQRSHVARSNSLSPSRSSCRKALKRVDTTCVRVNALVYQHTRHNHTGISIGHRDTSEDKRLHARVHRYTGTWAKEHTRAHTHRHRHWQTKTLVDTDTDTDADINTDTDTYTHNRTYTTHTNTQTHTCTHLHSHTQSHTLLVPPKGLSMGRHVRLCSVRTAHQRSPSSDTDPGTLRPSDDK